MWGDSGYQGVGRRQENSQRQVKWEIAMRPGKRRQLAQGSDDALVEKLKASVRAKVEHPFLYVKRHFGYSKVRYRGLAKNTQPPGCAAGILQPDQSRALHGRIIGESASKAVPQPQTRPVQGHNNRY